MYLLFILKVSEMQYDIGVVLNALTNNLMHATIFHLNGVVRGLATYHVKMFFHLNCLSSLETLPQTVSF